MQKKKYTKNTLRENKCTYFLLIKQCKKIISQKTSYTWNEDSVISIAKYMLLLFYVERVTLLGVHC